MNLRTALDRRSVVKLGAAMMACTSAPSKAVAIHYSVRQFGAAGDGQTDDTRSLQRAFDHVAQNGGTLFFPPGRYRISYFINLRGGSGAQVSARGVQLLGGPNVVIEQTNRSSGYERDGFRIGHASARDGGIGTAINIADATVGDFEFINCRIGVWVVYARNVLVHDIRGNRTAVVAVGNDNDDRCEEVVVRNIMRTAGFDGTFYTLGLFSVTNFEIENIVSRFPVSGSAVTMSNSRNGNVRALDIDQRLGKFAGIELSDGTQNVRISDFRIRNCGTGIVTFDNHAATRDKKALVANGYVEGCGIALDPQASGTEFRDIITHGNKTSLRLLADGINNRFHRITFEEGTLDDPANVRSLQHFDAVKGL